MKPPQNKCLWLALLCLPLALCELSSHAQTKTGSARWEPEIRAYEARDATNPPPQHAILFIGSSSIRLWKSLPHDFPGKKIINRGFGGSEIADSTAFADRILFPYHPRLIVMYAGDNDLAAGKTAEQVVADYKDFVQTVHAKLPKTRIAYISIKPCTSRWRLKDQIIQVNHEIAGMKDKRLDFIDIFTPMLGSDGKPRKDLLRADGLHPNEACYQLWASVIKSHLR